ncbi:MAG: exopolyphosphatase [Acidimicrobiales bacterium]|nr:exopolyphosphatase [Acidimicrobiales bacterium]
MRVANVSGFYGDRFAAPAEMLAGPDPIDVLTGDYLAELTMLILWKAKQKDATTGYAATFLRQMEEVLGTCLDRGVKVVTNAGGLNPSGLASRLHDLADRLGLGPSIAVVEGDDLADRVDDLLTTDRKAVTANAYLGGWGIATALDAGAEIVVCGRVTDAALVVGPAASWHGWAGDDWDRLAGAIVAGHVIECGPQATGGNYCFLDELPGSRYPGFPIAEIAADGSSVITKQPGTGGAVTIGTVTAQLLYEIGAPAYANPDAVARFDTIRLAQEAPDRVRISEVRGEPAPDRLKVAVNVLGGYRNTMTMLLTGLDIEAKADHALALLFEVLGGRDQFADVDVQLIRTDQPDAATNAQALAQLRVTVKDADPTKVGRRFANGVIELALASYAGFFATSTPGGESAYGVYQPAMVPASAVEHTVVLPDGRRVTVPHPAAGAAVSIAPPEMPEAWPSGGPTAPRPLGMVCGARSGDKGGDANVGVWARSDDAYRWLSTELTVERVKQVIPEAASLEVQRFDLPNLRALNFVIAGILGEGVASSVRVDAQAKGLGEYLRSRVVDIPVALLPVQ